MSIASSLVAPTLRAAEEAEEDVAALEELEEALQQAGRANEGREEEYRLPGTSGIPRLRRAFHYPRGETTPPTPAVSSTFSQLPFSPPPRAVLDDPLLSSLLSDFPHLFSVSSPINISRFRQLTKDHPNRPLVESIIYGLTYGFWPGHSGEFGDHGFDERTLPRHSVEDEDFLADLTLKDFEAGRTSPFFDSLLQGMLISPEHVVHGAKDRPVCDQSKSGLNDEVPRAAAKTTYDTLRDLGGVMRHRRRQNLRLPPSQRRQAMGWKSDVSDAFRNVPVHPRWQAKQAKKVVIVGRDGKRESKYCLDQRLMLGGRLSPIIWCTILNLILWATQQHFGVEFPLAFVDDVFGFDTSRIKLHVSHPDGKKRWVPREQALVLRVWIFVGIPWRWKKQEYSASSLTILGHQVDFVGFSVTLPPLAKVEYGQAVDKFLASKRKKQPMLIDWQHLVGYGQWAITTLPFARFAFKPIYEKLKGKSKRLLRVPINKEVRASLLWLKTEILESPPLDLLDPALEDWTRSEADSIFTVDACTVGAVVGDDSTVTVAGIGFWTTNRFGRREAYATRADQEWPLDIGYAEALAVHSAITVGLRDGARIQRLLVYSDSASSVYAFDSGRAQGRVHALVEDSYKALQAARVDLRVRHIHGDDNVTADRLSRKPIDWCRRRFPIFSLYSPPEHFMKLGGLER